MTDDTWRGNSSGLRRPCRARAAPPPPPRAPWMTWQRWQRSGPSASGTLTASYGTHPWWGTSPARRGTAGPRPRPSGCSPRSPCARGTNLSSSLSESWQHWPESVTDQDSVGKLRVTHLFAAWHVKELMVGCHMQHLEWCKAYSSSHLIISLPKPLSHECVAWGDNVTKRLSVSLGSKSRRG